MSTLTALHWVVVKRLRHSPAGVAFRCFASHLVAGTPAYFNHLAARERAWRACGHASYRRCWICSRWDQPHNLIEQRRTGRNGATRCGGWKHPACWADYLASYEKKRRSKTPMINRSLRFMLHRGRST